MKSWTLLGVSLFSKDAGDLVKSVTDVLHGECMIIDIVT